MLGGMPAKVISPRMDELRAEFDRKEGMDGMRSITVQAPWAKLMTLGIKTVEVHNQPTVKVLRPSRTRSHIRPRWYCVKQSADWWPSPAGASDAARHAYSVETAKVSRTGRNAVLEEDRGIVGMIRVYDVVELKKVPDEHRDWVLPGAEGKAWLIDEAIHFDPPILGQSGQLAAIGLSSGVRDLLIARLRAMHRLRK